MYTPYYVYIYSLDSHANDKVNNNNKKRTKY